MPEKNEDNILSTEEQEVMQQVSGTTCKGGWKVDGFIFSRDGKNWTANCVSPSFFPCELKTDSLVHLVTLVGLIQIGLTTRMLTPPRTDSFIEQDC